jgi:spore maturation protein CgeB
LVCSPWDDAEHLFSPGRDYLVAANGRQMNEHLRSVLNEPGLAESLAAHGLKTILARHTCAHRVNELLKITNELKRNSVAREPTEALMEIAK